MLLASLTLTANEFVIITVLVAIAITVFVLARLNRIAKAQERIAGTLDRIDDRQKRNEEKA